MFNLFRKKEPPIQKELSLSEQLALVWPMPEQTKYPNQFRSKKDPLRIGKEFYRLTVFPNGFWEKTEAFFYEENDGNIRYTDMDEYIKVFFSSSATEARSLEEWMIVLLAMRNFYRLYVWYTHYVCRPDVYTIRPALEIICENQTDIYVPLIQFIFEREIMDSLEIWKAAWEIAHSLGCSGDFLGKVAEGYLAAAHDSSYKAEYVGRAALLFAKSGDKDRAQEIFKEALGYTDADKRVFVAVQNGKIADSFSPQDRDVKTIMELMEEAGLVRKL